MVEQPYEVDWDDEDGGDFQYKERLVELVYEYVEEKLPSNLIPLIHNQLDLVPIEDWFGSEKENGEMRGFNAFGWRNTPQGSDFWNSVHTLWGEDDSFGLSGEEELLRCREVVNEVLKGKFLRAQKSVMFDDPSLSEVGKSQDVRGVKMFDMRPKRLGVGW